MDVLKTTSPTASPSKPCPLPRKTRPSSSSNVAVFFICVFVPLCPCIPLKTSVQATHFVHRPVSEHRFAVNVFLRYKPPHTAVVGLIAVIAQNIVMAGL